MIVRVSGIVLLLAISFTVVFGQRSVSTSELSYSSQGILYRTEKALELQLHTNGFSIGYDWGDIRKYYLTRYYHIGLGIVKHPKEYRQAVNFQSSNFLLKSSSAFAFGKQNNLIVIRAGIGEKRYFSEKAMRKGVAVGINYEGGISLGLLKPYYLNLSRVEPSGSQKIVAEKYSEENQDVFLDVNRIYGSASFFKGFNEIRVIPGLHGKIGAHFSKGAFDKGVRALEVGIMFDAYFQRVPIMVLEKNLPFFLNGYVLLQFGKRQP